MGQSERSLTSLGRHVAELQDGAPEAQLDRAGGRARLLRENVAGRERGRPRARVMVASLVAAIVAVTAVAAVLLVRRPAEALRFEVGAMQAGAVGEWIAAPVGAALPIRFSDGSRLRLAAGGRARVAAVSADGAEIALERGSLDLEVVHRDETRWLVRVGPFQVNVIGTRFEASWDPVSERCTIALREGAITVSGPVVGDARAMRAGERLVISPATGTLEASSIEVAAAPGMGAGALSVAAVVEPAPSAGAMSAAAVVEPAPSAAATGPAAGSAATVEVGASAPSSSAHTLDPKGAAPKATASAQVAAAREESTWRSLALGGKYKDALAAAEREGFDAICASAGASDLHALGEAARLGGDAARAARAFASLRTRFPASPEAASAAFLLGRSAQDRDKDHVAAAAWFARYLKEQPGGAFAAEAAGRLVEAKDRAGDAAGARLAAERYLAAHPSGSHAAYARSVIARDADAGAP